MTNSLIEYCLYWLNSFPTRHGVSSTISPASIVLGRGKPDFKYNKIAFGSYAQVYATTTNNMKSRCIPAIALKPSNEWGGHFFMSLWTGKRIHGYNWVELPISEEVIQQVESLAIKENQPLLVDGIPIFEWNIGEPILDDPDDDFFLELAVSPQETVSSDNDIDSNGEHLLVADEEQYDVGEDLGVDPNNIEDTMDDDVLDYSRESDNFFDNVNEMFDDADEQLHLELREIEQYNDNMNELANVTDDSVNTVNLLNDHIANTLEPNPASVENEQPDQDENVEESLPRYPVRENRGTGVERYEPALTGKTYLRNKHRQLMQAHKNGRRKFRVKVLLLMKKQRKNNFNAFNFLQIALSKLFLSPQMNARKGIKEFGAAAIAAMVKEFKQLDQGAFPGKPVVEPVYANTLSPTERIMVMDAVNLIKEKRNGTVKGRTCANGSRQRRYLAVDETVASPTISTEGLLSSFMIDAYESRTVGVFDIPGAYLHAEMKDKGTDRVILRLRDEFCDYMCEANEKYKEYVMIENGRKVLYLRILRALYGCIESALLWYELFTSHLKKLGFTINPYDRCVANKIIDGHQCTVVWYVDDAKVSHKSEKVVREVIKSIEAEFGEMNPTIGPKQEYLGMRIEITKDKKVIIDMRDQLCEILQDFSEDIQGEVTSPAAKHLMDVNDNGVLLSESKRSEFHSTVAKLLYIERRGRPDIETAVSFLTTRVSNPDEDDWKKLKRVLTYLSCTIEDLRVIGCDSLSKLYTWIDAAYAVHPNMRSHTGGAISLGWGTVHTKSSKQKLNTKSSTEAEVVGMSDYVPYTIWFVNFLQAQGYEIVSNTIFQDNQSAIRMEKNGRNSCTGNSRHIDITYVI